MIRHLVMVRYKHNVSDETKDALMAELADLSGHIDGIIDFQTRENVSVEDDLVRGLRNLFWFDFRDVSARDVYLADATHQAIGGRMVAQLEGGADGVTVCDFEV